MFLTDLFLAGDIKFGVPSLILSPVSYLLFLPVPVSPPLLFVKPELSDVLTEFVDIKFEDVVFLYPARLTFSQSQGQSFSLRVMPGETVAMVVPQAAVSPRSSSCLRTLLGPITGRILLTHGPSDRFPPPGTEITGTPDSPGHSQPPWRIHSVTRTCWK
jgi:hypothetical protein